MDRNEPLGAPGSVDCDSKSHVAVYYAYQTLSVCILEFRDLGRTMHLLLNLVANKKLIDKDNLTY